MINPNDLYVEIPDNLLYLGDEQIPVRIVPVPIHDQDLYDQFGTQCQSIEDPDT